jgi:YHS domain-containing protein
MGVLRSVKENKLKTLGLTVLLLFSFLLLFLYSNKVAPVSWGLYGNVNIDDGIALQGNDPVAYHAAGKRTSGNSKFSFKMGDATWYFSSASNKQLFADMPEKYMPQYGGYCAFAVSQGVTAVADPEHWTIQNGRLYVFNGSGPKETWVNEISKGSIIKADSVWATRL